MAARGRRQRRHAAARAAFSLQQPAPATGLGAGPGVLPDLPRSLLQRRPVAQRQASRIRIPRQGGDQQGVGRAGQPPRRGPRRLRILRRRPGGHRCQAALPAIPRGDGALSQPHLRFAEQPQVRHSGLLQGGCTPRQQRPVCRADPQPAPARHEDHPGCCGQPHLDRAPLVLPAAGRPAQPGFAVAQLLHL